MDESNTKPVLRQVICWVVSLVAATLCVNAFVFLYERPVGWIERTDSATDAIWRPGAVLRHGTEGDGVYRVDHNGYVNPDLPLARGGVHDSGWCIPYTGKGSSGGAEILRSPECIIA